MDAVSSKKSINEQYASLGSAIGTLIAFVRYGIAGPLGRSELILAQEERTILIDIMNIAEHINKMGRKISKKPLIDIINTIAEQRKGELRNAQEVMIRDIIKFLTKKGKIKF